MTKLASNLPQGDANGLSAIARDLIDEPHQVHVVVALVDCKKTTTDNDSGEIVPTARVRRIEALADKDDLAFAQRMMRRQLERRTGRRCCRSTLRKTYGQRSAGSTRIRARSSATPATTHPYELPAVGWRYYPDESRAVAPGRRTHGRV